MTKYNTVMNGYERKLKMAAPEFSDEQPLLYTKCKAI